MTTDKSFAGLKVAIVTNTAWNVHHFRRSLASQLQDAGASVIAMAPRGPEVEKIESAGVAFVELKHFDRSAIGILSNWKLIREFSRCFRDNQIDIALLYTPKGVIFGSIAGKKTGVPTISTICGLGVAFIKKPLLRLIVARLYKWSLKQPLVTVFQNEDDSDFFVSNRIVRPDQATIIPGSGVDPSRFSPVVGGCENRHYKKFLFAGRFLFFKGIVEFLTAAEAHLQNYPKDEFHVVGSPDAGNPDSISDSDLDDWKRRIPNLFVHDYELDMRPLFNDCDVFVLPSYREGMPMAVLEAMCMARPCIVSDAPGCRSTIVHGESGIVVPARQWKPLADAFAVLSQKTHSELFAMGEKGRKRAVSTFAAKLVNDSYLHWIRRVLDSRE